MFEFVKVMSKVLSVLFSPDTVYNYVKLMQKDGASLSTSRIAMNAT